jgi:PHD/YefM family antitoxin component YafN of YafNO toxin-antitoxin module
MGLRKTASLIIYRFRERGLEVFLTQQSDEWGFPGGEVRMDSDQDYIELEPSKDSEEAVAIEGDWHEIPSLKQMLYEESGDLKERLKEIEQGAFVSIKDALKQRLSAGQVEFLRELRDVIADRNSVRDI